MLRFLFAFLLAAPLAFGQVEIEPYISAGTALTVGTANTIPRWNGVPDDLVDSQITDDGTDVTATVGGVFSVISDTISLSTVVAADDISILSGDDIFITTVGGADDIVINADDVLDLDSGSAITVDAADDIRLSAGNDIELTVTGADQINMTTTGLTYDILPTNVAGAGTDLVTLTATMGAMDSADDIFRALYVNVTSADHTNGDVVGLDLQMGLPDGNASEYGIRFGNSFDFELTSQSQNFRFNTTQTFYFYNDENTSNYMWRMNDQFVTNANSANLLDTNVTVGAMNSADDVKNVIELDITNANHSDGTLNIISIGDITGDADALESAIEIGTGYDQAISIPDGTNNLNALVFGDNSDWGMYYSGGTNTMIIGADFGTNSNTRIRGSGNAGTNQLQVHDGATFILEVNNAPAAGASGEVVEITDVINAMNSADDLVDLLLIEPLGTPDHTGGIFSALRIQPITEDGDAFETPVFLPAGYDTHIVMQSLTSAPADDPPAGAISVFADDNADYSGGGGNDCAVVACTNAGAAQCSAGTPVALAILILNGACP